MPRLTKLAVTLAAGLAVLFAACASLKPAASRGKTPGFTQYVDPFIGTDFQGHVFLGANVPFGAVQLGPVNLSKGWAWCSGYHYSDSTIVGFAHTHLSGTGVGDLGDVAVMPTTGAVHLSAGTLSNPQNGYVSTFSHRDERARPGYYAVKLKRYAIEAELTASQRVGFHQYTFPQSDAAHVIFDLQAGIGRDQATDTFIEQVNDSTLWGYRHSKGWAADQRLYFAAVFSKPMRGFSSAQLTEPDSLGATTPATRGSRIKGVATFTTRAGEQIKLKVGISPVSTENALANIRAEIPHWNFRKAVAAADAAWNQELQKVRVRVNSKEQLTVF